MINQKTVELISSVMTMISEFVQTDDDVQKDFNSYIDMFGGNVPVGKILLPYIFERRIEGKSIFEIFSEKKKLKVAQKEVVEGLSSHISSYFEIKKLLKIGFELYNVVNEKVYTTYSMVKMGNYRGIGVGQYVAARIFAYKGEYYMLELAEVISQKDEEKIFRLAVAKQLEDVKSIYQDNPKKLELIEDYVSYLYKCFNLLFENDFIITSNQKADTLLNLFNEFSEERKTVDSKDRDSLIDKELPIGFFDISSKKEDLMEVVSEGFANSEKPYDVGIVADEKLGIFVIPFLNTFLSIFAKDNYKEIEGYKECVKQFLTDDKIPPVVLKMASKSGLKKFLEIINEVSGETFKSFKAVEKHYKGSYLADSKFSSTSVLYLSEAFSKLMRYVSKPKPKVVAGVQVGRNEPCPCGSGKKYKKCCGQA